MKMPKTGILDGIFRFISNVLMGMLVMKLIDFADALEKSGILQLLGKIGDFILDIGGKILNGLITFIDKGMKFMMDLVNQLVITLVRMAQEQFDSLAHSQQSIKYCLLSWSCNLSSCWCDTTGKIPVEKQAIKQLKKLKKMGLDDDQIKAYNKAKKGAGA